jgi:GNAT superfamily N-acetyltransferase
MWEQILATPPPRVDVLVLEIDGEVQGFAWTGPAPGADAPGDPGMVYAIYLRPGLEGHGLGRPLLAAGEAALAGQGFLSAVLHVARDNPRARRFYERAGWTPDGEERLGEVQGVPLVELVYKRALPTTSPQGPP